MTIQARLFMFINFASIFILLIYTMDNTNTSNKISKIYNAGEDTDLYNRFIVTTFK